MTNLGSEETRPDWGAYVPSWGGWWLIVDVTNVPKERVKREKKCPPYCVLMLHGVLHYGRSSVCPFTLAQGTRRSGLR